ncbi:MAG: SUMF1/EgtB/PvdO family nonheme iron enzyme [Desulfobacterales bacterium]|nr:SUMF1/EgtB/PvdO family nonheme iron enzyme [Desulfobacterales bacterium]
MAFDEKTWKEKLASRLVNWKTRMHNAGVKSIYAFVSAATLWPFVEAAKTDPLASGAALGTILAGVGTNLVANRIQSWKDEADAARKIETEMEKGHVLQEPLDIILEKLESFSQARERLEQSQNDWFVSTLREELEKFGNLEKFRSQIKARNIVVTGEKSKVATDGGVNAETIGNGSVINTGDKPVFIISGENRENDKNITQARKSYLKRLIRRCDVLPLAALGGDEDGCNEISLRQLYIELDTKSRVPLSKEERRERKEKFSEDVFDKNSQERPLSALDAATKNSRLVLLGDPGSGKSTFVKQLSAMLASSGLDLEPAPPKWPGNTLPLFISLSELSPVLQDLRREKISKDQRRRKLLKIVREQWVRDQTEHRADGLNQAIDKALDDGSVLMVFDGMDEVPVELRVLAREAVEALSDEYGSVGHVIVTCRIRSYIGKTVLSGFPTHVLAPFDRSKISRFIDAWYEAQAVQERIDCSKVADLTEDLQRAAFSKGLIDLASNPMLMTTMAIIHQREVGLPKERVRLYDIAVQVLLNRWQKRKGFPVSDALAEILGDDLRLRPIVERLAYKAHQEQSKGREVGLLSRGDLLTILEDRQYLENAGCAAEFIDYIDKRTGLIVGHGGGSEEGHPQIYGFPHRTFQEYLAGCHMVRGRNIDREYRRKAAEGDYWQVAAQLGAEELLFNRRSEETFLDLAYGLCPNALPSNEVEWRTSLWSGQMAALSGRDTVERDTESPDGGESYLKRLIPRLRDLMASDLTPLERAEAGRALSMLGDPIFRADAWYLCTDNLLGFVEIPEGPFKMGSDEKDDKDARENERPQHTVILPTFYIGKYPATVAQYRAFVDATNYEPENPDCLKGVDNHPVVDVTWYDALRYCEWLTETLRNWENTPEPLATLLKAGDEKNGPWRITLPSEAQWEKAARGKDGRVYPWGEKPNTDFANYLNTGIGNTSAVGCFPHGQSPYGCLDMAGNVWEWTRSLWGKDWIRPAYHYPYNPDDGRENPKAGNEMRRVLRGGSFYLNAADVRCACRNGGYPVLRFDLIGFRVVLSP